MGCRQLSHSHTVSYIHLKVALSSTDTDMLGKGTEKFYLNLSEVVAELSLLPSAMVSLT
jgi:hypothetical protein